MIERVDIAPNLRYERKFTIQNIHRSAVLHQIKKHPAFFREIYHPRKVNNIYLDTPQLKFFRNNQIGISTRKKIRIRWYGDTFGKVEKPRLEYKLKEGLLGDKWVFPIKDFTVEPGFSQTQLFQTIQQSDLPVSIIEDTRCLQATLLNTYHRTYFLSADQQYRLTLDEQMTYYRVDLGRSTFRMKHRDRSQLIIELKYAPEADKDITSISSKLPYRMDKSSKYVNGINAVIQPQ